MGGYAPQNCLILKNAVEEEGRGRGEEDRGEGGARRGGVQAREGGMHLGSQSPPAEPAVAPKPGFSAGGIEALTEDPEEKLQAPPVAKKQGFADPIPSGIRVNLRSKLQDKIGKEMQRRARLEQEQQKRPMQCLLWLGLVHSDRGSGIVQVVKDSSLGMPLRQRKNSSQLGSLMMRKNRRSGLSPSGTVKLSGL